MSDKSRPTDKLTKKIKNFVSSLRFNNGRTRVTAAILFVVIFAAIGSYVFMFSKAAGVATLTMSASSSSVTEGGTVVITISENSDTVGVNAVEADFGYDTSKLTFVSIDSSTGAFSLDGPKYESGSHVYIALGSATNKTGSNQVAKVTFTAKSGAATNLGVAAFIFDSSSAVVSYDSNTGTTNNELSTKTGTSVTVTDSTPPTAPTSVVKDSNTTTSITFHWTASTDYGGTVTYLIFRGTGATGTQSQVGTTTNTSFTDNGLTMNSTYNYSVQAKDVAGNLSAKSAAVALSLVDSNKPSAPTNLTVQSKGSQSVTLSWTASTDDVGVTGYRIYRAGTQVGTSTATTYTDNASLMPNTTYAYTVAAYDAAGNLSNQSTALNVTTAEQAGDVNGDRCTNVFDLAQVITNWNKTGMTKAQGNLVDMANESGAQIVNIYDLAIVVGNYSKGYCP